VSELINLSSTRSSLHYWFGKANDIVNLAFRLFAFNRRLTTVSLLEASIRLSYIMIEVGTQHRRMPLFVNLYIAYILYIIIMTDCYNTLVIYDADLSVVNCSLLANYNTSDDSHTYKTSFVPTPPSFL